MGNLDQLLKEKREQVHATLRLSDEAAERLQRNIMEKLVESEQRPFRPWRKVIPTAVIAAAACLLFFYAIPAEAPVDHADSNHKIHKQIDPELETRMETGTPPTKGTPPSKAVPSPPWETDEDKMSLNRVFAFGMSYDDVKKLFPAMGELRPEGNLDSLGETGLQESFMEVELDGQTATLELNFQENWLYAYRYHISGLKEKEAMDKVENIRQVYEKALGAYREEQHENGKSYRWPQQMILSFTALGDGTYYVSWGNEYADIQDHFYRQQGFAISEALEKSADLVPGFPVKLGGTVKREEKTSPQSNDTATVEYTTKVQVIGKDTYHITLVKDWHREINGSPAVATWELEISPSEAKIMSSPSQYTDYLIP